MGMFVRSLQTPDARYAIGATVSWLVYGALYIAMVNVVTNYAVASGISWILSYGVVYAFQKYGMRIPTQSGRVFRFDAGRDSDLKPAMIPN